MIWLAFESQIYEKGWFIKNGKNNAVYTNIYIYHIQANW